jgi:CCR4-NOT transcription complex subunit 3
VRDPQGTNTSLTNFSLCIWNYVAAEIDRVMKKVDEGVDLFDEIWEKVYSADTQNQKEKYEMDLKKEIKKLQRLRDQIKTWIGSSDVRDKDALVEARKLIETKMEQFKICEKETKTKTYSKEGLAKADKLDPEEEAKLNTTSWLAEYVEKFQQLVEEADFEIEKLSSGKGKKTNKHQIEEWQEHISNHKYHLSKLEGIIRLVNNDRLAVEPVDALKEDLDYYLESYTDDDYRMAYDQEFFYESLGLDELDVVNVDHVTQASEKKKDDAGSTSSKSGKDKRTSKKNSLTSVIPLTIGRARSKAERKAEKEEMERSTPSKMARASSGSSTASNGPAAAAPTAARTPAPVPVQAGGASMAAILKRETEQQEKERQKVCFCINRVTQSLPTPFSNFRLPLYF